MIMAAMGVWVLVFVVVKSISSSDLRQEGKCMSGFGFGIFVNLYILLTCVEPCKFLRVKQCFRLQFLFRKLNYVVHFILKIITSWNNEKKKEKRNHQDNDEVIHGFLLKQRGKNHGLDVS